MGCNGTNRHGEPCQAPEEVVGPDGFCNVHRPGDEHREVSSRGGKATAKKLQKPELPDEDIPDPPASVDDLEDWLSWAMHRVATGQIEAKEGRVLGYLARALLDTLEQSDLEADVEDLQEKIRQLQSGDLEVAS